VFFCSSLCIHFFLPPALSASLSPLLLFFFSSPVLSFPLFCSPLCDLCVFLLPSAFGSWPFLDY
jgi:hypothetical protein